MSDPIRDFLARVRARLKRRLALGGVTAYCAALAGAVLMLLLGAGAFGPSTVWRPLGLAAIIGAAAAGVLLLRRARSAYRSDDAVARYVGEAVPALGGDLLSAVELERELPKLTEAPILSPFDAPKGEGEGRAPSPELVRAHRRAVALRLGRVEPHSLVDMRRLRRASALRIGGVVAGWALAFWVFPGALHRGWAELRITRGERVQTSVEPIVADLELSLVHPAYTGIPPRVIPGSSGQVLALPGTEVTIQARALMPTRSARLVLEEDGVERELPVEVKDGRTLRVKLVPKKSGAYRFVIDGPVRRVREPEAHRIDLEPDRAPRVDLYAPSDALEVAGPRRIELGYAVDDDYGLGEIALVWRAGSEPEGRRVITRPPGTAKDARAATGKLEWDLADLDLKPGVRVAYHLEAKDNDSVLGPNIGISRTYYLSMFSPREKHEAALADQEKLLELATVLLAERLEVKRGEDGELADPYQRIHGLAEGLVQAIGKAQAALAAEKASAASAKELKEMHGRLGKLTHDEEQLLSELRDKKRRGQKLAGHGLEGANPKHVSELERDVLALDDLLGRQRLEELLQVGDEMQAARDRLKALLAQYKKERSEAVRKDIERELREIERRLAELKKKAAQLAAELPDQFLNAEAMGKNDMQSQLDKIRELLEKGDIDKAMAELERMSSSLDKMMAGMEQDLKGFRKERFSAEDKALAELEDKLSDLEHDEQQLKSETEAVRQRTRAEAKRQMRDTVEPFVKHAREQVAQLKKHLEGVEPRALSPYDTEELGRIKQRVEDLDKMLQGSDLEEARGMARQADQGLQGLANDLRDEESRAWRGPRPGAKRAREHVEEGEKLARQLAEQIDKVLPRPNQLMSPEDSKKMGEMAERQQATRRRTQELGRDLERKLGADGKPMQLPPQLGDGLKEAARHMERAEGELRRRDARDAAGEEGQALENISKLKEQMQRERRPKEQMAGGRPDKEPVKIPGADEYRAPKEFRQDLLEAMKRTAPAEYKEQVKRYYEELVK